MASEQVLQESLHAATRSLHNQLNRLITARLPLCLPPHATDPTAYLLGIAVFGEIFTAFELGIEHAEHGQDSDSLARSDRDRHIQILQTAQTVGLERREKLRHDMDLLLSRLGCETQFTYVQQHAQAELLGITKAIEAQPYLALAYQWTMYLALFNGGRFLQRTLASAGPDFWQEAEDRDDDRVQALSFWDFDAATTEDPHANTLKLYFKANLTAASELLTAEEKEKVIQEAVQIFQTCLDLVAYMDEVMAQQNQPSQQSTLQKVASRSSVGVCRPANSTLWHRLRNTSTGFVEDWLGPLWRRPLVQDVKD